MWVAVSNKLDCSPSVHEVTSAVHMQISYCIFKASFGQLNQQNPVWGGGESKIPHGALQHGLLYYYNTHTHRTDIWVLTEWTVIQRKDRIYELK